MSFTDKSCLEEVRPLVSTALFLQQERIQSKNCKFNTFLSISSKMYPLPENLPQPSAPPLEPPYFTSFEKPIRSTTDYTFSNPPVRSHDMNSHSPTPWSTGLCSCCSDINSCCLTCWCPCVAFGRIAEIVDRGSTTCGVSGAIYMAILGLTGCPCLYSCLYRSKLRAQYFVEETPCTDCCVHCCCEECALCQEYRHLQNQGFDLSIGWHGNVERQKRVAKMLPMAVGAMSKN